MRVEKRGSVRCFILNFCGEVDAMQIAIAITNQVRRVQIEKFARRRD